MCFNGWNETEPLPEKAIERVEMLKAILMSRATGSGFDADRRYGELRRLLLADAVFRDLLPRFIKTHTTLSEFWSMIKGVSPNYAGRREFLRKEFEPAIDFLEARENGECPISIAPIQSFDSTHVRQGWDKCLARVDGDPEGAITAARALLESLCKHILEALSPAQNHDAHDLVELYKLTSETLGLAPSQHTVEAFKKILGGCTAVVYNLATLRNRLGDAHGRAPGGIRPAARHSRLAVNLAGSMAVFLIETFEDRQVRKDNAVS